MTNTPPNIPPVKHCDNPNLHAEWRQFLYNYYMQEWQNSNGHVSLDQIYPIAKKKFESRNKSCDIELGMMANRRKHRKTDPQ
jgi:hypothetical protein